jgi:hypothetical protein
MLEFPQAVNSSLAAHPAVQGNHTPSTEPVNVAKGRRGRHLRLRELQDFTGYPRMLLEFPGFTQDNQGVLTSSSRDVVNQIYLRDFSARRRLVGYPNANETYQLRRRDRRRFTP